MKFVEKTTIKVNDNPNGFHLEEVNECLLIGEKPIHRWDGTKKETGYYTNWIWPAFYAGRRAWIHESDWNSIGQHCGSGGEENILEFEKGCKMLFELGVYGHLFAIYEEGNNVNEDMICDDENYGDSDVHFIVSYEKVAILNVPILTREGKFFYETISLEEAQNIWKNADRKISAIGHEATASILTTLMGEEVAVNRIDYEQADDEVCLIFKLKKRIPEGTILTDVKQIEEIGYDFGLLKLILY